jgi:RNA polymerase sigma factor (TIGR02999 family)
MAEQTQLTELIHRMQNGDREAGNSLFAAAAARLRKMSAALMASERTAGFHASDLVQEAYAQKVSGGRLHTEIKSREHFFSLMAVGMRQVLMDRGRTRGAQKRQVPPAEEWLSAQRPDRRLIDLSTALQKLEKVDPDSCAIVRMKHDYGLTWEEIAVRTGRSVWQARAEYDHAVKWLRAEIG